MLPFSSCATAKWRVWWSSAATARRQAPKRCPSAVAVVGVASTIDNDLAGSDVTIGLTYLGHAHKPFDPRLIQLARVLAE